MTRKKNASNQSEGTLDSCPNCGYCPHCGQSRQAAYPLPTLPYWPHYVGPVSPWWGVTSPPYVYQPTWTSGSVSSSIVPHITGSVSAFNI